MSAAKLIELQDISLTYRLRKTLFASLEVPALRNISFAVWPGETLGIIGRNGCGKSTLLRVMAGIFQPDTGSVVKTVDSISLMTLSLGLDPVLSGRQNAIFGGMLLGFSRKEVEERMPEIRAFSGLEEAFDQPVKSYSSGMVSRLSFSVAINMSPDVMLLDEILSVGDEEFRTRAHRAMMGKIQSDQTTVFVSHSAAEIEQLCNRVILMDGGRILDIGDPVPMIAEYRKLLSLGSPQPVGQEA